MNIIPFIHGSDLGVRLDLVAYYQRRNGLLVIGLVDGVEVVVDDEALAREFVRALRDEVRADAGPDPAPHDEGGVMS